MEALNPSTTWDWNGIVGTGQSLSVGDLPILTTHPRYNNLKLALGSASIPPWDPNAIALTMEPLVERRNATELPAAYPDNLWGETPHSAMANQISHLVRATMGKDFISVHSIVGESAQGISALKRQGARTTDRIGRAFAAALFEASAIKRLATVAGKSYGIGAVVLTHGETDWENPDYRNEVIQLHTDFNAALRSITGQAPNIPMLLSQQFAFPSGLNQRPIANQVQWRLGIEYPDSFVCTGPKYQYDGQGDSIHLASSGYQQLGEKAGQVYFERIILGRVWRPLQPVAVTRNGRTVTVEFHVPVAPLRWDETLPPLTNAWPTGRGFELSHGDQPLSIESVRIAGNQALITSEKELPAGGVTVAYAMASGRVKMPVASHAMRWGQLCDSDPFVGASTGRPQPNYAISFAWGLD